MSGLKKLRVLLITEDFFPMFGGVAVYLHNIIKYSRNGITVVTIDVKGKQDVDSRLKYPIKRVFLPKRIGLLVLTATIGREILKIRPDVVIWGDYSSAMLSTIILKGIFKFRQAVIIHGTRFSVGMSSGNLTKQIVRFCLQKSDILFANSNYNKNRLMQCGVNENRIKILNPGVDVNKFHTKVNIDEVRKEYGLNGKKILLTVARLISNKNHEAVLGIIPEVIKLVPNLAYLVVGDGTEGIRLRNIAKELKIEKNVIFIEQLFGEKLVQLYNACDIFVMPNKKAKMHFSNRLSVDYEESFGIVFLEANACGKPVIGGNSGGAPEAIVDGVTGYLVNPDNKEELKDKILKLLLNPELARKMGENGKKRAQDEFNWEKVTGRFDKELDLLLR